MKNNYITSLSNISIFSDKKHFFVIEQEVFINILVKTPYKFVIFIVIDLSSWE